MDPSMSASNFVIVAPLVPQYTFHCAGLVVNCELVDDGLARFIEADYFDFRPLAAEFQNNDVQCRDAGNGPDMGAADVDRHLVQGFLEIEGRVEIIRGGEKSCPSTV